MGRASPSHDDATGQTLKGPLSGLEHRRGAQFFFSLAPQELENSAHGKQR